MKITKVVDLGNGLAEATFDDGTKAQYRKEDLEGEAVNPTEFKSEVRNIIATKDTAVAKEIKSKKGG